MGQQPLAVLTEGAVLKARLIQIHIQKPTNEEVGVQPLNGIEGQPAELYISAKVGDSPAAPDRPPF